MSDYPPPPSSGPGGPDDSSSAPPPPPGGSATPPPPGTSATPPPAPGDAGQAGPPPAAPASGPGWGAPPAGAVGARPGELLDRFVARLIDHIGLGIVNAIVVSVIVVAAFGLDGGMLGMGGSFAAGAISAVLTTAINLGYFAFMETSQGRTLGKMVMKLRVIGANGGKPTMEESVKRNVWLALPILGIIPILGGLLSALGQLVAVIMIAVGINNDTQRRRPWTDEFAGTQVLKEG